MEINRTELFEELLAQFRVFYPAVGANLNESFLNLVNTMVVFIMNK
jgi:hypothetical protein